MITVKENASEILYLYLRDHGIKQNYVARKMGISSANFSSRLHGRLKFNAEFALAVAKALDIDPTIFLK